MSKGLGQLQNDVLFVLSEKGSWLHSWAIACEICEKRATEPTHTFDVSTRRAINSLAKRQLVRIGERESLLYRGRNGGYDRLAVWLPTQDAPDRLLVPLEGKAVESKIAAYLQSPTDKTPMLKSGDFDFLQPQIETGDVSYYALQGDVPRRLATSQYEIPKIQAAIRRAILRMEKRGQVAIKRTKTGGIGLVRPIL
jgi:hypothetical protein